MKTAKEEIMNWTKESIEMHENCAMTKIAQKSVKKKLYVGIDWAKGEDKTIMFPVCRTIKAQ